MGTLVCPLCCGHTFSNSQSLRYHLLSVTDNVICPGCDERFDSVLSLADHLNENCGKHDTEDEEMEIADDRDESRSPENLLSENQNTISPVHDIQVNSDSSKSLHDNETSDTLVALQGKDESTSPKHSTTKKMKPEASGVLPSLVSDRNESSESVVVSANQEDDVEEYSCSTCQITFSSVAEHIEEYHLAQDIVVEMNLGSKAAGNHEHVNELIKTLQVDKETASESKEMLVDKPLVALRGTETNCRESNNKEVSDSWADTKTEGAAKQMTREASTDLFDNDVSDDNGDSSVISCDESDLFMDSTSDDDDADSIILQYDSPASKCEQKQSPSKRQYGYVDDAQQAALKLKTLKMGQARKTIQCERKIVHIKKFWEESDYYKLQENSELIETNMFPGMMARSDGCIPVTKMSIGPDGGIKEVYECNKCVRRFSLFCNFQKHTCLAVKLLHCIKENAKSVENGSNTEEVKKQKSNNCAPEGYKLEANIGTRRVKKLVNVCSTTNGIDEIKKMPRKKRKFCEIRPFVCETCNTRFSKIQGLKSHICRFCKECGTTFPRMKGLLKHMENVHNTEGIDLNKAKSVDPVTCEICNTLFPTAKRYKLHRKMHDVQSSEKYSKLVMSTDFKCDICGTCCSTKRTLLQHMKIHNPDRVETPAVTGISNCDFVCKVCQKPCASNEELQEHWKSHAFCTGEESGTVSEKEEEDTDGQFVCNICGRTYDNSYKKKHMSLHTGQKLYPCDVCNKKFYTHSNMMIHKHVHTGKQLYVCPHCMKSYRHANGFKAHLLLHKGKQPYACGFCNQRFSRPHEKVKHERIHTGEKPHMCPMCGMKFRIAYSLTLHMRVHTGIRPYKCNVCDKTFKTQTCLLHHSSSHSDVRAYSCSRCPKSYKSLRQLNSHENSHTRPVSCAQCPLRFASPAAMRKHMKCHTNLVKFSCTICGAHYGKEHVLRNHMKIHIKNEGN